MASFSALQNDHTLLIGKQKCTLTVLGCGELTLLCEDFLFIAFFTYI